MPSWMNAFDDIREKDADNAAHQQVNTHHFAGERKMSAVVLRANNKWRLGENCVLYHGYKPSENRKLEKEIRSSCSVGNGVDCVAIVKGNEIDGWLDSAIYFGNPKALLLSIDPIQVKISRISLRLDYTLVQICHLSFSRLDDINVINYIWYKREFKCAFLAQW